jgi:hypothetical protein
MGAGMTLNVRDHRTSAAVVRDHRTEGAAVRDHRQPQAVVVRDHRQPQTVVVRDHRSSFQPAAPNFQPASPTFGDPGFSLPSPCSNGSPFQNPFQDSGFTPSQQQPNYQSQLGGGGWDASAMEACRELLNLPGQISGQTMAAAIIGGTCDKDGNGAGSELNTFLAFAQQNASKLSPEASKMLGIYQATAAQSQAKGDTGISETDFSKMISQMRTALATDGSF